MFHALALPRYPSITLSVGTYISVHLPHLCYHSIFHDNIAVLSFPPHLDKSNHAQRCSTHHHDSPHTHTHLPPPPPPLPRADIPHDHRPPHATPSRTSPLLPSLFPFPQAPTAPFPPLTLTSPLTNPPPHLPRGVSALQLPRRPRPRLGFANDVPAPLPLLHLIRRRLRLPAGHARPGPQRVPARVQHRAPVRPARRAGATRAPDL